MLEKEFNCVPTHALIRAIIAAITPAIFAFLWGIQFDRKPEETKKPYQL
jgi:hypothetical protein